MELTELLKNAIENVKSVLDVNRVIGTPVTDGRLTILPVTKMIIGFAGGGGEAEGKLPKTKELPVGGVGGGANIVPIGFLIVGAGSVKYIRTEGGERWDECLSKILDIFS